MLVGIALNLVGLVALVAEPDMLHDVQLSLHFPVLADGVFL